MAEIPSEVRSSEKEQAPHCGVAIIEDADICRKAKSDLSESTETSRGLKRPREAVCDD